MHDNSCTVMQGTACVMRDEQHPSFRVSEKAVDKRRFPIVFTKAL